MQRLEQWTVLMYSKNCSAVSVNEARKLLFTHSLKSLDSIPPTKNALFQHAKRALHTAAFVWKLSLSKAPKIPDPSEWGWEWNARTKVWVPYWTDLDDVSKACALILHCGCVVACKNRCKCHRAGLRCTTLCKCDGGCTNNDEWGIWINIARDLKPIGLDKTKHLSRLSNKLGLATCLRHPRNQRKEKQKTQKKNKLNKKNKKHKKTQINKKRKKGEKTTASTRPPLQVTRNGARPACETNVANQAACAWQTMRKTGL